MKFKKREQAPKKYKPLKSIEEMSESQLLAELERIDRFEKEVEEKKEKAKLADPFWFYEPSDGTITDNGRALLQKWLKPDDIPQILEGQIHVHRSTAPIVGASGGNQVGKSLFSTIETLIKVTREVPIAMESWYPREKIPKKPVVHYRVVAQDYTNGLLKNVLPTYRQWTPREYLVDGIWEKSFSEKELTLKLGRKGKLVGTIEFMSNQQDLSSFGGPPRDGLVFDEEPLHVVFKANLMRMTTAEKMDVLFAMTPDAGMSWVYDEIVCKPSMRLGDLEYKTEWFKLSPVINRRANMAILDGILSKLTSYEEVKLKLLGEFVSLSGLVYGGLFNPRVHVIPPFETGCSCGTKSGKHPENCPYAMYLAFVGVDPHMVKASCAALCVVDREDNFIVDTCYKRQVDTDQFKEDYWRLVHGKRVDWTTFDPSSDSSITMLGGLNVFKICTSGKNAIRRAFKADKFPGSIAAGVDTIKRRLRVNDLTNRPRFFIMDRPENQELIRSFKTLQRDTWANEDVKGQKDKIAEGVHDHHACVRYVNQRKLSWKPLNEEVLVSPIPDEEAVLF